MSEIKDPNEPGDCCPDCKVGVDEGRAEMWLQAAIELPAKPKMIKHTIDFSDVKGKAGDVTTVWVNSDVYLFRCEQIFGHDTADNHGTKMRMVSFGDVTQLAPVGHDKIRYLTAEAYDNNKLGCGLQWPKVKRGEMITIEIEFLVDCRWEGMLVGRAIEETF